MACKHIDQCGFFDEVISSMPHLAQAIKETLCETNAKECARCAVESKLGWGAVPNDLIPTDHFAAGWILKKHEREAWSVPFELKGDMESIPSIVHTPLDPYFFPGQAGSA